jgi:hypothetical protein
MTFAARRVSPGGFGEGARIKHWRRDIWKSVSASTNLRRVLESMNLWFVGVDCCEKSKSWQREMKKKRTICMKYYLLFFAINVEVF